MSNDNKDSAKTIEVVAAEVKSGVSLEQFIADSGEIRKESSYLPGLFRGWVIRNKRELLGSKKTHAEWEKIYKEFAEAKVN